MRLSRDLQSGYRPATQHNPTLRPAVRLHSPSSAASRRNASAARASVARAVSVGQHRHRYASQVPRTTSPMRPPRVLRGLQSGRRRLHWRARPITRAGASTAMGSRWAWVVSSIACMGAAEGTGGFAVFRTLPYMLTGPVECAAEAALHCIPRAVSVIAVSSIQRRLPRQPPSSLPTPLRMSSSPRAHTQK